jgi:Mn-dependent DtxR family transcriptional regulator
MGGIDETARRLLREMGYQAEGSPTPDVLPREAADSLDLDPSSPEYEAALNHLMALGDIERKPDQNLYRLTRTGFKRAEEIRWR